jgi:TolB-like protein
MMKILSAASLLLLALHGLSICAQAGPREFHVLVLPFPDTGETAPEPGYGRAAAEMMEVCLSQAEGISAVDRSGLDALLAEHRLSLTGLADEKDKLRIGALAGAKVLVSGSLHFDGLNLRIDGRVFDTGTGIVIASHSVQGERGSLAEAVHDLCGALSASLLTDGGKPFEGPVDDNPLATLHFMRGLGLYHAARYEAAIGEFFRAEGEVSLSAPSRLWAARAYLALNEFANACLELQKLERTDLSDRLMREVDGSLDSCRGNMNDEEAALVRGLLSRK